MLIQSVRHRRFINSIYFYLSKNPHPVKKSKPPKIYDVKWNSILIMFFFLNFQRELFFFNILLLIHLQYGNSFWWGRGFPCQFQYFCLLFLEILVRKIWTFIPFRYMNKFFFKWTYFYFIAFIPRATPDVIFFFHFAFEFPISQSTFRVLCLF